LSLLGAIVIQAACYHCGTCRQGSKPWETVLQFGQQVQYFRNHEHRMDYPTYVRNGWQIGSGPVESACKTVVGNRLKGGGMCWGEDGADAVCHLRALYLSEPCCWDAFWSPPPS
jgi:hypothetical protein